MSARTGIVILGTVAFGLAVFAPGACSDRYVLEAENAIPDSVDLPPLEAIYGPADVSAPVSVAAPEAVRVSAPATLVPPTFVVAVAPPPVPVNTVQTWTTYDCPSFRYLFDQAGLPWDYFGTVVMPRESHCDPLAFNHSGRDWSFGLTQLNTLGANWGELQWRCGLTYREQLFDPLTNLKCAKALYDHYGKAPWRT